jgi:hypothetical protein
MPHRKARRNAQAGILLTAILSKQYSGEVILDETGKVSWNGPLWEDDPGSCQFESLRAALSYLKTYEFKNLGDGRYQPTRHLSLSWTIRP